MPAFQANENAKKMQEVLHWSNSHHLRIQCVVKRNVLSVVGEDKQEMLRLQKEREADS